jgi:UDP-glucose 6-dehydrogenase
MVCAQIDQGSLEREVVVYLSTIPGGTAERKQKHINHSEFQLN